MRSLLPLLTLLAVLCWPGAAGAPASVPFADGRARLAVKVGDLPVPYRVFGLFVMPGEAVTVEVLGAVAPGGPLLQVTAGEVTPVAGNAWRWRPPEEPGLYPLVISDRRAAAVTLNAFVMVAAERARSEHLNGYRMGRYPDRPLRGLESYRPPRGFVEVTPENADIWIAPHFRLGQFLCKQGGGFPKYLALDERLIAKLELILEKLNAAGHRADSLHVMSGYRTPFYNRAIGNVPYSRHVFGDAADIFPDADGDGLIDDLDGDLLVTKDDALYLYRFIDDLWDDTSYRPFRGGLGLYGATPAHGPFVHVDVRGTRARWGS